TGCIADVQCNHQCSAPLGALRGGRPRTRQHRGEQPAGTEGDEAAPIQRGLANRNSRRRVCGVGVLGSHAGSLLALRHTRVIAYLSTEDQCSATAHLAKKNCSERALPGVRSGQSLPIVVGTLWNLLLITTTPCTIGV